MKSEDTPPASDTISTDDPKKDKGNGKDKEKEKKPSVPLHQLFRYADKTDALLIACAALCSIVVGVLGPVSIIIFGRFLGNVSASLTTLDSLVNNVLPTVYMMFYLAAGTCVASYLAQVLWILSGERQARRIRYMYLNAILRQEQGWFDAAEEGSLTTRLATDTQMIQDAISEKFGLMVQAAAQLIGGLVVGFTANWILSFVVLATFPIIGVAAAAMGILVSKSTTLVQDAYAGAGKVAEQAFSGIRTLYAFGLEDRFVKRYEGELVKAEKAGVYRAVATALGTGIFFMVFFFTYALAFWYGSQLVTQGRITGSNVIVAFFGILIGAVGVITLPQSLAAITGGCGAAHSVFHTIQRESLIDVHNPAGEALGDAPASISLKDVTFSYPTRPDITILDKFSLDIPAGSTVAFVGASGSGKSTIMQLLLRFYDVNEGEIEIGGKPIKNLLLSYLRGSLFGYVGQEPVLFNLSIKQNILLGVPDSKNISDDAVIEACKQAMCHEFIQSLPEGYETIVGEGATLLSGGQKQRIAIARAIIGNPDILLLDEATSALDTQSERLVQRALDEASKDRTTLMIAHRLSTVRNADMIVVMKNGCIVESGTHNSLVERGGVYADLVTKQMITQGTTTSNSDSEQGVVAADASNPAPLLVADPVQDDDQDIEALLNKEKEQVVIDLEEQANYIEEKSKRDAQRRGSTGSGLGALDRARALEKEKKKAAKKQKAPMMRVFKQMRTEWPLLLVGMLGGVISGCVFPAFGYVFGQVTVLITSTTDLNPGPMQGANFYAFLMTIIGIGCFVGFSLKVTAFEIAGERYSKRLRAQTFRAYLRQEIAYYDESTNSTGAMTTRLAVDCKNVNEMITKTWGEIVQVIVTGVLALVFAFVICWQVTLVILAVSPFLVVGGLFQSKMEEGYGGSERKANEECGEIANEAIKEIRTVASLGKEHYFEKRYAKSTAHPHKLAMRKAYTSAFGYACVSGVPLFAQGIAFYAGLRFMANGWISYNNMFSSMTIIMMGAMGVGQSMVFQKAYTKGKMSSIEVFELVDRHVKIDPSLEGIEPSYNDVKGEIDLKDIEFTYPTRQNVPIFKGKFNLHGAPLTKIALVGASGCGKSTTISMLERFYDPTGGSVRLDDHDVRKYTLSNLRAHLSIVQQEPIVFDLSIDENIRYGYDGELTKEQVADAAKLANIYDFISSLPEGFDTRVGEKGSQLSGGQKQRIAIARALVRKPKVLLLDEATSALDSESEKLVQEALDQVLEQGGRTTITIAHRLSSIQNSDLICVVADGQIKEQGTHLELLAKNGIYAEMVQQQSLSVA
ncbi:putative ABC transporter protein [Gongronella butleri]|nr:putative ABC transporter protein [Gongronella butleri]